MRLQPRVGDDPATRFVAEKIIEWAQRGIRDPDKLWKLTVNEFGLSDKRRPQPATVSADLK